MRLRAFAVPIKLESGTGGYPLQLAEFPISFSLSDFCAFYWRVKRLRLTLALDVSCDSTTYGPQFLTINTSFPIDIAGGSQIESDRVADAYAYENVGDSDPGGPGPVGNLLAWSGTSNDAIPPDVPINGGRVDSDGAICGPSPQLLGKPWIRGHWTGEQGGDAGIVIPRIVVQVTFPGVRSDSDDCNFDFYLTSVAYTADPLFFHQGGVTTGSFLGQQMYFQWTARIVDFDDDGDFTINNCTVTITADEWFPFENAEAVAVYNSATGAELIDPLTAPVP